jgi:flavin reductase (DIM6/NTAB) family NADH-FMN oxidoreductase RutF
MRQLTPDEFRELIGHFATGVTIVTAVDDGRSFGTTASAVTSLSLEPPMLLICMNKESETGRAVASAGRFAVNILGEQQVALAQRFAQKGGDKFGGVPTAAGESGAPLIEDALATLECRVVEQTTGGTHTVFFGEVEAGTARDGAPLAYYRGRFGTLQIG